jgi:DNA-binding response OmpR family regulator
MSTTAELLLVEDDLLLARALQRSLTARGIRSRHMPRCAHAALLSGPYPLGVFDIELPDGDGIELARQLLVRGVVARVVFYTACVESARLARARSLGPVFTKSVNLHALLEGVSSRPGREPTAAAQTSA